MTDTQTAVPEADQGEAKPSPDAAHEPSLQDLLAQYNESKKAPADTKQPQKAEERVAPQPTNSATPSGDDDEIREWVRQQREKEQAQATEKAVTDAIGMIRESDESLADVSEKVLAWAIYGEAANNPALLEAFALRETNPAIWQRAMKELGSSVANELASKPDPAATAGREAARASVRGTTQTRPDPDEAQTKLAKDVSEMSRAEFEAFKRGLPR